MKLHKKNKFSVRACFVITLKQYLKIFRTWKFNQFESIASFHSHTQESNQRDNSETVDFFFRAGLWIKKTFPIRLWRYLTFFFFLSHFERYKLGISTQIWKRDLKLPHNCFNQKSSLVLKLQYFSWRRTPVFFANIFEYNSK